jgi:putative membrane protein
MLIGFLITVIVLAVSLWIVSLLPTGVEVDSPVKALLGGAIIGACYGFLNLFPQWLGSLAFWLSLGIIPLIISIVIFGLAAWLVEGFRLKWGIMSAILGAIALTFVNSILSWLLQTIGLVAA